MDINRLTHTRDDACGIASYYSKSVGPGRYSVTNLVPVARQVNPLSIPNLFYLQPSLYTQTYLYPQPSFYPQPSLYPQP